MTHQEPQLPAPDESADLDALVETLRLNSRSATRRDVLRWSAIAAGALATARLHGSAMAAAPARQDQPGDVEQNAEIAVPFDAYGQKITLDPHRSADYGGFWVLFPNVWNGLLRYDEMGRVSEDLAESYDRSEDDLTYTFKIRQDAKFASGKQVVADDFIRSWTRAVDPANPSPMVTFMQHVAGYQDVLDKKDGAQFGVRAVDPATVEVTLSQPYNFFPSYMASFVWSVIDAEVLDREGDDGFILADAGAGPWRFTSLEQDQQFVMEPNPNYFGGRSPSIAKITWPILTGPTAASDALERYKNDEVVSADVPLSLKKSVEGDLVLKQDIKKVEPSGHIRSLAMDFLQPPFDDVRVRLAFAKAVDRERFSEIYEGTWTPSTTFTPPVVAQLSEYEPPQAEGLDVDGAKQLLADAGFPNGEGLPEIIYYHPTGDAKEEVDRLRAFLATFKESLGVEITLDDSKTAQQITDLQTDNGGRQIDLVWWQTVTDTPHLLSQVFRIDSTYMKGVFNWSPDLKPNNDADLGADAKQFDDLTARADIEQNPATRNDLYKQAESLMLKDAVYIPIANWVPLYVQKPWLQGTKQGPWSGRLPALFDKDVVVLRRDVG